MYFPPLVSVSASECRWCLLWQSIRFFKFLSRAPANNFSRADSPTKSHDSERVHSPGLGKYLYLSVPHITYLNRLQEPSCQLSLIDNLSQATGEPRLTKWRSSSLAPTAGPEALDTPQLPSREKFVSHVYCRMCRRDPCRQPAATMCGHIFCHQCVPSVLMVRCIPIQLWAITRCISSEVVKTSQCPVCEAPTLLYSIFRLHLA